MEEENKEYRIKFSALMLIFLVFVLMVIFLCIIIYKSNLKIKDLEENNTILNSEIENLENDKEQLNNEVERLEQNNLELNNKIGDIKNVVENETQNLIENDLVENEITNI